MSETSVYPSRMPSYVTARKHPEVMSRSIVPVGFCFTYNYTKFNQFCQLKEDFVMFHLLRFCLINVAVSRVLLQSLISQKPADTFCHSQEVS